AGARQGSDRGTAAEWRLRAGPDARACRTGQRNGPDRQPCRNGCRQAEALKPSRFRFNQNRALDACFGAFSSREPGSTSLENAMKTLTKVKITFRSGPTGEVLPGSVQLTTRASRRNSAN